MGEEELIKIMAVKKLTFPIYVNVNRKFEDYTRWVKIDCKGNEKQEGWYYNRVEAITYTSPSEKFNYDKERTKYVESGQVSDVSIKTGFVYVVKDEK